MELLDISQLDMHRPHRFALTLPELHCPRHVIARMINGWRRMKSATHTVPYVLLNHAIVVVVCNMMNCLQIKH